MFVDKQKKAGRMDIIIDVKPLAPVDQGCVWEESLDKTALAALQRLPDLPYEIGGVIYEKDGKYCYSVAVSNRKESSVSFRTDLPQGARIAAFYHTHPTLPRNRNDPHVFSPADVKVATNFSAVSYIRIMASNLVKKFIPEQSPLRRVARNAQIADGEVVIGPT